MANINDISDYIVVKLSDSGSLVNVLKLHKLLYYTQAWSLAFGRGRLFDERFQAWVHGPVSRQIYNRYPQKTLYSAITLDDINPRFDSRSISSDERAFVDGVLEVYAPFTGAQLEEMTHIEQPWIDARAGAAPNERSENVISESTMQSYYAARMNG